MCREYRDSCSAIEPIKSAVIMAAFVVNGIFESMQLFIWSLDQKCAGTNRHNNVLKKKKHLRLELDIAFSVVASLSCDLISFQIGIRAIQTH